MSSKIFVSIACFMDNDILNTIDDCLKKAKNPSNIIFGICFQYDGKNDFLKKYDNNPQFKIYRMHYNNAKGPAYARAIIYSLFNNEDYFFQIDCHTRFFENWDTKLLNSFALCKKINPKAIISYYPINNIDVEKKNILEKIANISTVRCIDIKNGIKTHGKIININETPKTSW